MTHTTRHFMAAVVLAFFVTPFAVRAAVINVPADEPTIQDAILAASDGDEIVIAPGTYGGPGNVGVSFWNKRLTVRSSTRDPADVTIDCAHVDRAFHVVGESVSGSVIQGLRIVNGSATHGGAISVLLADITILDCDFTNNSATSVGGAVYFSDNASVLRGCRIRANIADMSGGGLGSVHSDGTPIVDRCAFLGNVSFGEGGGLYTSFSGPDVTNCVFSGNETTFRGGGMFRGAQDDGLIVNCVLSENHAGLTGGGVAVYSAGTPIMKNTIVWGNTDDSAGDRDQIDGLLGALVVLYSCVQDGWTGIGFRNTETDPMLEDPDGADDDAGTLDDDCRLKAGSPCIDAGVSVALEVDLDGNRRVVDDLATPDTGTGFDTVIDLGPYEFASTPPCLADVDGNGQVDFADLLTLLADLGRVPVDLSMALGTIHDGGTTMKRLNMKLNAVLLVLVVSAPHASASIIEVPGDYTTIQAAVDAAVSGDQVVISPGLYTGPGNNEIYFGGKKIAVRSSTGDPSDVVIDCNGAVRGFKLIHPDDAGSVLRGLTILDGSAFLYGGAIQIEDASVRVEDCWFVGNSAGTGGAMSVRDAVVSIRGCRFFDNSAQNGGAVYVWGGGPGGVVDRCEFLKNTASDFAGGLGIINASATVTDCLFTGNHCDGSGGALAIMQSADETAVINCTLTENTADVLGGGIFFHLGATALITNTIVWRNVDIGGMDETAQIDGGGGSPIVTACCVQGTWTGDGARNIDGDPRFVDADGADNVPGTIDDDCRLLADSPCIDAGITLTIELDLDGYARAVDDAATPDTGLGEPAVVDMGAYEFPAGPPCLSDVDGDGQVGFADLLALLADWGACP